MRKQTNTTVGWSGTQAYVLAVVCLALGVALGYLFRGSASPVAASTAAVNASSQNVPAQQQITPEQQKAMVESAIAPLIEKLKTNPGDFGTIVQVANSYYDGKQYADAIKYYRLAVKDQPTNPDLLTDLGTAIWYTGDADGALAEFDSALKSDPKHAGTLFNQGVVRWQGKMDPKGAMESWEKLLKLNSDYPQKQEVQEYIEKAKQHAKG